MATGTMVLAVACGGGGQSLAQQYRNGCRVTTKVRSEEASGEGLSYKRRDIDRIFRAFPNTNKPENVPRDFYDIDQALLELPTGMLDEQPGDEVVGVGEAVDDLYAACEAHHWDS